MTSFPLPRQSMMFAPMEGITDETYRLVIGELYPEWDTYSCDFLRVPNPNPYPLKHVEKHFGKNVPEAIKQKSIYQILTSPGAYTAITVQQIASLNFHWLDLNLGCPSKTVCKHHGGSFLLSDLPALKKIITTIRQHFPGIFTCKIRVGYEDDSLFENILKLIEDCGVDAIIIHARTRTQLYKGIANWDYIKRASKLVDIPVIGNGDIWTKEDINRYYDYTGCHSIMLARSALKTPWMAKIIKHDLEDNLSFRTQEMAKYFFRFYQQTQQQNLEESSRIKRLKSVSRYLFDDIPEGADFKKRFLLSKTFEQQWEVINQLKLRFA